MLVAADIPRFRQTRHRRLIFLVSLGIKLPLAYVFFGSVDLQDLLNYSISIFDGDAGLIRRAPYFPTFASLLWFAGAVNALTPLPLAFCYKIIPVLFDAMLAVLVYDFALLRGSRRPLLAGMLYATAPVAVIINSFHVQFDSILIYFLMAAVYVREFHADGWKKFAAFGGLFLCSVLIKPVAAIFLPFFLVPPERGTGSMGDAARAFLKPNLLSAAGVAAVLVPYTLVLGAYGINPFSMARYITEYANTGITIIGLPFAWPFTGLGFLKLRMWIAGPVLFIGYVYLRGRIGLTDSVILVFTLILGLAGFPPQYLIWPLPFLLATGRLKSGALYGLAVALFQPLYYMNPLAPNFPGENMATFAALIPFEWAMPPAYLSGESLLVAVKALGNYAIPLISLAIAASVVLRLAAGTPAPAAGERQAVSPGMITIIVFPVLIGLTILALYLFAGRTGLDVGMAGLIADKASAYSLHLEQGQYFGNYGGVRPFNVVYVGLVLSFAWSAAAGLGSRTENG